MLFHATMVDMIANLLASDQLADFDLLSDEYENQKDAIAWVVQEKMRQSRLEYEKETAFGELWSRLDYLPVSSREPIRAALERVALERDLSPEKMKQLKSNAAEMLQHRPRNENNTRNVRTVRGIYDTTARVPGLRPRRKLWPWSP